MTLSFIARLGRRAVPTALLLAPAASVYYYQSRKSANDGTNINIESASLASRASNLPWSIWPNVSLAEAAAGPNGSMKNESSAGESVPSLPSISAAQVRATKHNTASGPVYVTFGNGVYDISEFVESHPGGDQILLAAGGPLEKYWTFYPQHNSEFVYDMLEELRVGNLVPDDQWRRDYMTASKKDKGSKKSSPYDSDPKRHPALIVQTTAPYTAEPPAQTLVSSQYTPNELFYVRNHMPVPTIDASEYRLRIVGRDGTSLAKLTLDDLRSKFEKVTVSATVQCAGNRRNELDRFKKVKGGSWEIGAISNARWTGARLSDVLTYAAGSDALDGKKGAHLCCEGLDRDPVTSAVYATSVPIDVVRRHPDVILAYEMNDEPLPRDHGYPVRIIVPGIAGARHVKWLGTITLSNDESQSHWQRNDYKSFGPDVDWSNVDFDTAPSIQEMPVVSAICSHSVDRAAGTITMSGYAWSGDGKGIIRVDVSADGGKSWTTASLTEKDDAPRNQVYDWTLWTATVNLPKENENVELVCKAVDSAYNSQPDGVANIWNLRGLLNNAWHRVGVSNRE